MSLDYQRYYEDGWKNKPDRSTPVVAEALNNIDDAIIEIEEVLNHGVSEDATVVLTGTEFEPFFANKGNILIHEMLGKTVQDGTPSPSNPVDMESVKVDLTTRSNVDSEYSVADTSIVLRGFGDYQDRLFFEDGKFFIEKNIEEITLDGTENGWQLNTESGQERFYINFKSIGYADRKSYGLCRCNYFVYDGNGSNTRNVFGYFYMSGSNIVITDNNLAIDITIDALKEFASNTKIVIEYVLTNPTIKEVSTDDTIKLLSLMAFDGETHIIQNSVTKGETVLEYPNNRVGGLALTGFCKSTKNEIKIDAIDSLMTTMMLEEDV